MIQLSIEYLLYLFKGEILKMSKLILFHGTPDKIVQPVFGGGEDRHDYGKGFYLTESSELAKEWAVCRPNATNGWYINTNLIQRT